MVIQYMGFKPAQTTKPFEFLLCHVWAMSKLLHRFEPQLPDLKMGEIVLLSQSY